MFEKFPCGKKSWQTLVINLHTNTRLLIRLLRQSLFLSDSPYYTLVVGAQPAVSRFLFRQAVFCAATVRSIILFYELVAAVNPRIFIATLSFAAKAFSILNKGPNHLKSKLWNFNPILFFKAVVFNISTFSSYKIAHPFRRGKKIALQKKSRKSDILNSLTFLKCKINPKLNWKMICIKNYKCNTRAARAPC